MIFFCYFTIAQPNICQIRTKYVLKNRFQICQICGKKKILLMKERIHSHFITSSKKKK
jgi:hypothetical protein